MSSSLGLAINFYTMQSSRRYWTDSEIRFIRRHLGRKTITWIAEQLNRTPDSIWGKAKRLKIAAKNFSHSLSDIIRDTGYNWKQILNAKKELKQVWEQNKGCSKYHITEEQKEELLRHLAKPGPKYYSGPPKSEFWCPSLQIYRCLQCGESSREHHSLGLCTQCFHKSFKDRTRHARHKMMTSYWKLAVELKIRPSIVHPLDQLDQWNSCTDMTIGALNLTLHTVNDHG